MVVFQISQKACDFFSMVLEISTIIQLLLSYHQIAQIHSDVGANLRLCVVHCLDKMWLWRQSHSRLAYVHLFLVRRD